MRNLRSRSTEVPGASSPSLYCVASRMVSPLGAVYEPSLHAHPGGLWHSFSQEMQESPHGQLFVQCLQQPPLDSDGDVAPSVPSGPTPIIGYSLFSTF